MKKINFYLFLICLFLLNSCVASQDEIKELKVKVVNLETLLNTQNQKYIELEKKVTEIDQKINSLENRISKELMLDIKTQIFSELEEIKKEQALFSNKLEELSLSKEQQSKEFNFQLSNLSTQIQTLQLKLTEIERKIESLSNATIAKVDTGEKPSEPSKEEVKEPGKEVIKEKPLTEIELYEKAYSYYQKGEAEKARKFFEEYIERFPKGKWIGQAHFWIGESYFKEKKYEEAILSYQKLIELEGWHPLKPSAMLKQALSFKALGDVEAYKILLKRLINQYPNSKEAQEAKKLLKG